MHASVCQALGARYLAVHLFGGRPEGKVARDVPEGLIEAEDPDGSFHAWLRASRGGRGSVAIVRPDRFVFALARGDELSAAKREFARQMHCGGAVVEQPELQPAAPALARAA